MGDMLKESYYKEANMKCPFCQQELSYMDTIDGGFEIFSCDCKQGIWFFGNDKLWQELDRTRKALDLAIGALKEYADEDNWGMGFAPWLEDGYVDSLYTEYGYKTARQALEQINQKEE